MCLLRMTSYLRTTLIVLFTLSVSGADVASVRAAPSPAAPFSRPPSTAGLYVAPDLVVISGRSRRSTYDVLSHRCHQMSRCHLDTRRPTLTLTEIDYHHYSSVERETPELTASSTHTP